MNYQKIFDTCDKIIRFAFYALIYFTPISIALVETFASIALVSFFVKRGFFFHKRLKEGGSGGSKIWMFLQAYKPETSHLSWPIGTLIFMNAVSVVFSQNLELSIKGFFFKLLQGAYLYFNFIEAFKTKKQLQIFIAVFLVSATFMGIDGIVQLTTGQSLFYHHPLMTGRVTAAFKHPNDFGSYLVVVYPLMLGMFLLYGLPHSYVRTENLQKNGKECSGYCRVLLFSVVLLTMACLGLTLSRGAWVGAFAAMLFLGIKFRKLIPLLLVFGVIFWFIFIPRIEAIRNVSMLSDDVSTRKQMDAEYEDAFDLDAQTGVFLNEEGPDGTWGGNVRYQIKKLSEFGGMGRRKFWSEAWMMIKESPIVGTGLNTYSNVAMERKINRGGYAHNCYLQMTSETGILGLVAFLWIIASVYRHACSLIYKMDDRYLFAVSAGILAGLTGFLVHIFVDTALYSVQLGNFLWVIFGILVAAQRLGKTQH